MFLSLHNNKRYIKKMILSNIQLMEIKRNLWTVFLCLCSIVLNGYGDESPLIHQANLWFEWGEYPKIIRTIPSFLSDSAQCCDSMNQAKLRVYLGVARFAEGEVWKARNEFLKALELYPGAFIDKNYVSQEIYDFFLAIVEEVKQKNETRKEQELLAKRRNEQMKLSKQEALDSLDRTVRKARRHGFLISAIITSVLTVGTGGYAGYEYYLGELDYDKFRNAAARGDLVEYERFKDEVRIHDTRTIVSGSVSGLCAITSTVFYILAHKHREKRSKAGVEAKGGELTCSFTPECLRLIYCF